MRMFKGRLAGDVKLHGSPLAIIAALTLVMGRNLIFSADFPGGWDVASITYPITYFARTDSYFSLWEDSGTGYVTPITLFHLLAFVADTLGDPALVSRAVLVFAVLFAALFMYLYSFSTTRRRLASVAAGIIFSTSPWFAANTADGHGFLIVAYGLAPLSFLLVDRGLERVTLARVLGLGLLLSLLPSLRLDPIAYIARHQRFDLKRVKDILVERRRLGPRFVLCSVRKSFTGGCENLGRTSRPNLNAQES